MGRALHCDPRLLRHGESGCLVRDAWFEDVEETLRPLVDAGIAAAQNGLTRAMVEELIDTVWVSEEGITVDFKADEMLRSL